MAEEVVIVSTVQDGNTHILNINTGVTYCTFKGTNSGLKGIATVGNDHILASNRNKGMICAYQWGKVFSNYLNDDASLRLCRLLLLFVITFSYLLLFKLPIHELCFHIAVFL